MKKYFFNQKILNFDKKNSAQPGYKPNGIPGKSSREMDDFPGNRPELPGKSVRFPGKSMSKNDSFGIPQRFPGILLGNRCHFPGNPHCFLGFPGILFIHFPEII